MAGAQGWQPYHLHVPIVLKSGSLNFLESSGPVQGCNRIALPFTAPCIKAGTVTWLHIWRSVVQLFSLSIDFHLLRNVWAGSGAHPASYWIGTVSFEGCITTSMPIRLPGSMLTVWIFRNKIRFYGEELLAPRPTPKLEDQPLSAVRDYLFNILAATLHIGGRHSIRNPRMRHAVLTGAHLFGGETWGKETTWETQAYMVG
jgi:hypothetical protein